MRKTDVVMLLLFLLLFTSVEAQSVNNSLKFSIDYVWLNQLNAAGVSYAVKYSRYFSKRSNRLEGKIGYLFIENSGKDNSGLISDYNPKNEPCLTANITLKHDFFEKNKHALQIGFGPSVWYLNKIYKPPIIKTAQYMNIIIAVGAAEQKMTGFDWGYNADIAYTYRLQSKLSFSGCFSYMNLKMMKTNFWLGIDVGYYF